MGLRHKADGERIINSTAALADRAPASSLLNHMRQSMECAGPCLLADIIKTQDREEDKVEEKVLYCRKCPETLQM